MRQIGHFIGGEEVQGTSGRFADVFQPMTGEVVAKVALASRAETASGRRDREEGAAGLGGDESAAPRPRHDALPRPHREGNGCPRRSPRPRARQDRRRRQGRHPARRRGRRVLHRHRPSPEGRVHRGRRARHRHLLPAPAPRRRRRHHAVQLPGHDPAVEACAGDRRRQRLHPEAVRARSGRADAARRTDDGGGPAGRHPQRRQRRQGRRRRDPRRSRHPRRRLRRLLLDRRVRLFPRRGDGQARAVLRRRQEPHDHHARRRHGPGRRRPDRRRLRLGRRALHGRLRRRAGRQGHRGIAAAQARARGSRA